MIEGVTFTFCVAEAIWNSLNVDVNLCRSMYKSFVELNGRDYPMMIGKHHLVLFLGLAQVRKWSRQSSGMLV